MRFFKRNIFSVLFGRLVITASLLQQIRGIKSDLDMPMSVGSFSHLPVKSLVSPRLPCRPETRRFVSSVTGVFLQEQPAPYGVFIRNPFSVSYFPCPSSPVQFCASFSSVTMNKSLPYYSFHFKLCSRKFFPLSTMPLSLSLFSFLPGGSWR